MSLRQKSIAGIVWALFEQFGMAGTSFLIDLYLTRLLDPADFGLIGMILVFVTVGQGLLEAGMISSLIRMKDPGHGDYSTIFYTNAFFAIVIYAVLYFGAPFIASFYNQPMLVPITRVYALGLVFSGFSIVQQARMRKEFSFKTHARIQIVAKLVAGAVGVGLAVFQWNVWSLAWMYIVHQAMLMIQFWLASDWRPGMVFSRSALGQHLRFGYKLTIASFLDTIASNVYYLIVGRFFSPLMVGYYLRADQIKQLPVNAVSVALGQVTLPLFASLQDDAAKLRSVYKRIMQQAMFCIAPVLLGAAALAAPGFELVLTSRWLPAVPYFRILCLAGILYPLNSYNLNILKAMGRSDLFLRLEIIKKSLLVVIIIVALPFGIFGLLTGQVVMSAIAFFINSYYSGKFIHYGAGRQLADVLPVLLLAMAIALLAAAADQFFLYRLPLLPRVAIGTATGMTIYVGAAAFLKLEAFSDFMVLLRELRGKGKE